LLQLTAPGHAGYSIDAATIFTPLRWILLLAGRSGQKANTPSAGGVSAMLGCTDIPVRMRLWVAAKSLRLKLDSKYQVNVAQLHGRRPAGGVVKQHIDISMSSLGSLNESPTARASVLIASVFNGALRAGSSPSFRRQVFASEDAHQKLAVLSP
jgi:hypothetical protein